MKNRKFWAGLGIIAGAAVFSGSAFAAEGKVLKLSLKPGRNQTSLMISHTGAGKFRLFKSERQNNVVIEAENLSLPPELTRTIESSASDGPVLRLTPYNSTKGNRPMVKLVLQLRGQSDITSSEHPGGFLVEIAKKTGAPGATVKANDVVSAKMSAAMKSEEVAAKLIEVLNSPQEEKKYFGSKVTFDAKDVEVPDIFRLVGDSSDLNIVWDAEIAATKTSLSVKDLPWDQLLDLVVQQKNFKAVVMGNVVRIMSVETFNAQAKARKEELALSDELEPIVMAVIPLSFAEASDMKTMITELIQERAEVNPQNRTPVSVTTTGPVTGTTLEAERTLTQDFKRGRIEIDKRTNSLIVTNTKDSIERMRRLIKELDIPVPQILIDAKIIIASENFSKQVGVRWQKHLRSESGSSGAYSVFGPGTAETIGTTGTSTFALAGGAGVGEIGFGFGASERANLKAALQLSEINETSRSIASPRVIVNNNTKAEITDGSTITQLVAGGSGGGAGSSTVTAELKLSLTPSVTSRGSVQLRDLTIERGQPRNATLTTTSTDKKSLKTEVLVESGATLVLGGVYQFDNPLLEQGIPVLKDLPFIGGLFRAETSGTSKSELMVFITPQIIDPEGESQAL